MSDAWLSGLGECERWTIIGLQMNATDNDRRHGPNGHVFEGRFRCRVIENERYAWTGSRHPARAIVARMARQASSATLREIARESGLARRDCVPKLSNKARRAAPNSAMQIQIAAVEHGVRREK